MSRTERRETVEVPARISVKTETDLKCDGCGGEIGVEPDVHPDQYANELYIALNGDECVSMLRRRDYCTVCLEPIWEAINKLIKADPDQDGSDPANDEWEILR